MKKLGVFQNKNGEWIVGPDAENGGVCETKELAEQLLALHNKYYGKQVSFDLGVGKVVEVGLVHEEDVIVPNLYIRFKNAKWKRAEAECTLI
jgi:hypothetical protein